MKHVIVILSSLFLVSCYNQTKETVNQPLAKEYLNFVYEQCEHPDIIEVESTYDGYIEVEYICNGTRYEIGIRNNSVLYKEHSLTQAQVPLEKISRKLEKKYPGWKIDEVSEVIASDTSFLKVEVIKDGIEQNLYFTQDGKWYKIKPIDVASQINFTAIEKNDAYVSSGYDFNNPKHIYDMPELLREISGIELYNDSVLYCVQDEIGSVFEYDLKTQQIVKSHRFTDIGDFEDLTMHKNYIYVLRSDGSLFTYNLHKQTQVTQSMIQINSLNIEGICYYNSYLYIASKDPLVNHSDDIRVIHRVPTTNFESLEMYLEIEVQDIKAFMQKKYPELNISEIQFNPSSIAIHPITSNIYILSATDRFIAVYSPQKEFLSVIPLSPDVYYKPEGISFYTNGDMLISSEGDKKGFVKGSINFIPYK